MEQREQKNLEQQIAEMAHDIKKIKRRLLIMAIGSYAHLLFLLIPLIIAAIYLPSLIRSLWGEYGMLFQGVSGGGSQDIISNIGPGQIDALIKQLNR